MRSGAYDWVGESYDAVPKPFYCCKNVSHTNFKWFVPEKVGAVLKGLRHFVP